MTYIEHFNVTPYLAMHVYVNWGVIKNKTILNIPFYFWNMSLLRIANTPGSMSIRHQNTSLTEWHQGADSIKRYHLTSIGNPIVEIRRSYEHLISTMRFPILLRQHIYIESGPNAKSLTNWIIILPLRATHISSKSWLQTHNPFEK